MQTEWNFEVYKLNLRKILKECILKINKKNSKIP